MWVHMCDYYSPHSNETLLTCKFINVSYLHHNMMANSILNSCSLNCFEMRMDDEKVTRLCSILSNWPFFELIIWITAYILNIRCFNCTLCLQHQFIHWLIVHILRSWIWSQKIKKKSMIFFFYKIRCKFVNWQPEMVKSCIKMIKHHGMEII